MAIIMKNILVILCGLIVGSIGYAQAQTNYADSIQANTVSSTNFQGNGGGLTNISYNVVDIGGSSSVNAGAGMVFYPLRGGSFANGSFANIGQWINEPGIYFNLTYHVFSSAGIAITTNSACWLITNNATSTLLANNVGSGITSYDTNDNTHQVYIGGGSPNTNKVCIGISNSASLGGTCYFEWHLLKLLTPN
jgi:hypothetical protein